MKETCLIKGVVRIIIPAVILVFCQTVACPDNTNNTGYLKNDL